MCKSFCSLFSNHKKEEEFIDEDRKASECIFESAKNGILSHRTHFRCAKRLRSEVIRHKRRVTSSLSRLFSLIGMEH